MEPRIFHNNDAEADRIMKLAASDRATLLIDFLRAAQGLATQNNELYEGARFAKLTETELEVELYGRLVKQFDREIKAVTCHGVAVRQNATGIWEVEIDLQ
jgi:SHS2 domain-containing protein